jgi:hypothetical protein
MTCRGCSGLVELEATHLNFNGARNEDMARLTEYLGDEEFDALEEVCEGRNASIAEGLRNRLIGLGYIEDN